MHPSSLVPGAAGESSAGAGSPDASASRDSRAAAPAATASVRVLTALLIAVMAQGASLALLSTDPWRGGLLPPTGLARTPALIALGALVGSAAAVGLVAVRSVRIRETWRGALRHLTRRPLALLTVNALLAVAVVRPLLAYPVHVALTMATMVTALLALLIAGAEAPPGLRYVATTWVAESRTLRWYAAGAAVVVSASISAAVFHRIPHIPDEVVYLFQAKALAAGQLSVPELPGGRAWDVIYTIRDGGRWFGIFPPGWPAVLALGVRAGAPWLVNPLLTALVVLAVHGLTRRAAGLAVANWAALALATSPWFLFLGASMMSHIVSLLFTAIVLATVLRLGDAVRAVSENPGRSGDVPLLLVLGGGVALGALVLTRPIEGVVLGLTFAAWLVAVAPRVAFGARGLVFGTAALVTGSLYLPYNAALTGRALRDPITLYFDTRFYAGANRLGFGSTVGNLGWGNDVLPGHSPLEALINANLNSHLVQLELFGWGVGSLLVVLAHLTACRRRVDRTDALMWALVGAVVSAYAVYWYSGADFGPRYWSQLIIPLTVLSARGVAALTAGAGEGAGRSATSARRNAATWATALLLASVTGAPLVVAARAAGKYHDYRGMTTAVNDLARRHGFANVLVLLRGDVFSDYAAGMVFNDAHPLAGRPVYARFVTGPEFDALRRHFPDRSVWIVDGPSLTGGAPRATQLTGAPSASTH